MPLGGSLVFWDFQSRNAAGQCDPGGKKKKEEEEEESCPGASLHKEHKRNIKESQKFRSPPGETKMYHNI